MKRKSNKLVAGVGVNDADYPIVRFVETINGKKKREWICPYYKTWSAMLNRCYRLANDKRYNSYSQTTVCQEWHTFSNFKSWMEKQDWEGKDLDKDLLTDNNQYSPSNCVFIPSRLNTFLITEDYKSKTGLPGIYFANGAYRYKSEHEGMNAVHGSNVNVRVLVGEYISYKRDCAQALFSGDIFIKEIFKYIDRLEERLFNIVDSNPDKFPVRDKPLQTFAERNIGDCHTTNKGFKYKIVKVIDCEQIVIEFEDGSVITTRGRQITTGAIRKPRKVDKFKEITERIDKIFKWNSHGLISGIQYYNSGYVGVSYKATKRSGCKYFKNLTEAVSFRKECLLQRVESIIGKHLEFKDEAFEYFNTRWEEDVVKYSGKMPT